MDVVSGERTLVVPNAGGVTMSEWPSGPVWSPDGTWLAYAVGGAADGQVVATDGQVALVPTSGSIPPVYFAPANVGAYEPRFSPDGSQLAFTGVDGSGVRRLYVADRAPDGTVSNPRVISHGTWDLPRPQPVPVLPGDLVRPFDMVSRRAIAGHRCWHHRHGWRCAHRGC